MWEFRQGSGKSSQRGRYVNWLLRILVIFEHELFSRQREQCKSVLRGGCVWRIGSLFYLKRKIWGGVMGNRVGEKT